MKLVGLTGGIACGKSTALRLLLRNGINAAIDMDLVARECQLPGHLGYRRIVAAFGEGILSEDGEIDRDKLGAIVFGNAEKRRELNRLMWLPLALGFGRHLLRHFALGTPVVILDAPLLFETGLQRICSIVVVVTVDRDTQVERLVVRDGRDSKDAENRIDSQMPLQEKARRADVVLDNSGTLEELEQQVLECIPILQRRTWHRFNNLVTLIIVCGVIFAVTAVH